MGRPREHDERTAAALLEAAERAIQKHGPDAVSIRGVAADAGTTTRAVYSLFGCKQGLIAALGAHAFDLLREGVERLPDTAAPEDDVIEAGLEFRRFAHEHPSLFRLVFQNTANPVMWENPTVRSAAVEALNVLRGRVARLEKAGLLHSHTPGEATLHLRALCAGLVGLELAGAITGETAERLWRQGLSTLVSGFASR